MSFLDLFKWGKAKLDNLDLRKVNTKNFVMLEADGKKYLCYDLDGEYLMFEHVKTVAKELVMEKFEQKIDANVKKLD